jgi:hypothetical protein
LDQTLDHDLHPDLRATTFGAGGDPLNEFAPIWLTQPGGLLEPTDVCGHISIDRTTDPVALVELAFLQEVASGRFPHTFRAVVEQDLDPDQIVHPDTFCERSASSGGSSIFTIRTERSLQLWRTGDGRTSITVAADHPANARVFTGRILQRIDAAVEAAGNGTDGTLEVMIWGGRMMGRAAARTKRIEAPDWKDIRVNYPDVTLSGLDELHGVIEPHGRGQLVVFHGSPGTGKTTAVRSLARAWAPWCRTHVISDPERLFGDVSYLTEVVTRRERGAATRPWRLIVLEDGEAALATGPGRLLNLTDGILGQGVPTIVLVTTNVPGSHLPDSLLRPGRALATVEFERFTAGEARRWLGAEHPSAPAVPADGASLAELYELRERVGSAAAPEAGFGVYL